MGTFKFVTTKGKQEVIIKVLDLENNWSWFSDVKETTKLGFNHPEEVDPKQYGSNYVDIIGNGNGDALILRVTFRDNAERMFAFYAKQAYLVDDKTGSTIDSLI